MVYVTHDQGEAMTLAGRIAILHNGTIVQVGAPLDLYHRPVNTFVATFLGSPAMNILDAGQDGTGNRIGIRPEDVQIATTPQAGWDAARALVVEPMGNEMLVTITTARGTMVARAAADLIVDADQELWIRLPPERLHTFDAGGARLP